MGFSQGICSDDGGGFKKASKDEWCPKIVDAWGPLTQSSAIATDFEMSPIILLE